MVYQKPWTFRLGVIVFGTVAFLAATGRSIGPTTGGPGSPSKAKPVAPVVLEAAVRS